MTKYAIKSGSQEHKENTRRAIRERTPFKTGGSLYGVRGNPGVIGKLNIDEREAYYADAALINYVVFSYVTPIAWHTPGGWHIVAQRFSPSTSWQQAVVRLALADEVTS